MLLTGEGCRLQIELAPKFKFRSWIPSIVDKAQLVRRYTTDWPWTRRCTSGLSPSTLSVHSLQNNRYHFSLIWIKGESKTAIIFCFRSLICSYHLEAKRESQNSVFRKVAILGKFWTRFLFYSSAWPSWSYDNQMAGCKKILMISIAAMLFYGMIIRINTHYLRRRCWVVATPKPRSDSVVFPPTHTFPEIIHCVLSRRW